jgi:hypothetical protein
VTVTLAPTLPGISFEAVPRPLDEALPRMDVSGFVGFASSGPIDVPVVVEDPIQFRKVFGDDPVVARTDAGEEVRALLGPAVEGFFANGGARAWVVRVARTGPGGAVTNRFRVPGVLVPGTAAGVEGWRLAALPARSPGAWSDGRTVGAVLEVGAVVARMTGDRLVVDHAVDVVAGDLIRLNLGPGRNLYVVADDVTAHGAGRAVGFDASAGWVVTERPPLPIPGAAYRIDVGGEIPLAGLVVEVDSVDPDVVVTVPAEESLAPGDLLAIEGADPAPRLTLVRVGDESSDLDDAGRRRFAVAALWDIASGVDVWPDDPSLPGDELLAEIQRLRLTVRNGESVEAELDGLGLGRAHPRSVMALPDDDHLYALLAGVPRRHLAGRDSGVGGRPDRSLSTLERDASSPRFPLAGGGGVPVLLPLGVTTDPTGIVFGPPPGETSPAPVRNGLGAFGAELFVDPALAAHGVDTIMSTAWDLTSVRRPMRWLRGVHALATNDDVTLVCVPDALHTGWDRITIEPPPPLQAPVLLVDSVDEEGAHLRWTAADTATGYELEHDADAGWSLSARSAVDGLAALAEPRPGCAHWEYARVRARRGTESGPWSNTVGFMVPVGTFARCGGQVVDVSPAEASPPPLPAHVTWRARPAADAAPWAELRAIQSATLRWCAARGDVFAVLALPAHFTADEALRHVGELRGAVPSFDVAGSRSAPVFLAAGVPALTIGESDVLGYGALYHPWPVVGRPDDGRVRVVSPDGAVVGTYAARALARGAWVAPGRIPLDSVLALAPAVDPARHLPLARAGVNPIAADVSGFMALTASTMSDTEAVRPVNVRRLIMLLRRLARRAGDGVVFEPNDRELQRLVHLRFERLLTGMFQRGAFAGAVPAEAFEVSTGDNVNPPGSADSGRFVVVVRFAPSRPLEFVTVRLVLAGKAGGEATP